MLPSKENIKFPLLLGLILHLPALSGIGFSTAFFMFMWTSCTIASGALALMHCLVSMSVRQPILRTVTSVIVGSVVGGCAVCGPRGLCAAFTAAAAYDAWVMCTYGWVIARVLFLPLLWLFLLFRPKTSVKSSSLVWLGALDILHGVVGGCGVGPVLLVIQVLTYGFVVHCSGMGGVPVLVLEGLQRGGWGGAL